MRFDRLQTATVGVALLAWIPVALAQDPGHSPDGQVPGPNATQPQADGHSSNPPRSVQPVPGAMPGSETVPSTLSEKNAADDALPTLAYTFRGLSDEQRKAIAGIVMGGTPRAAANAPSTSEIGTLLPPSVPLSAVPGEVVAQVPQTNGYAYAVTGGKILLVAPASRTVVGVIQE